MSGMTSAFSENNGSLSSMRLLVGFVIVVQMLGWAYVVYKTGTLPPMDWQQAATVIGPLIAKAWQKGKEEGSA